MDSNQIRQKRERLEFRQKELSRKLRVIAVEKKELQNKCRHLHTTHRTMRSQTTSWCNDCGHKW